MMCKWCGYATKVWIVGGSVRIGPTESVENWIDRAGIPCLRLPEPGGVSSDASDRDYIKVHAS